MDTMMRAMLMLAGLTVVLATPPAVAEECPAGSLAMDDIIAALNASLGCNASMKVFQACQMGSTADVQFGGIVEKKCEAAFLSRLNPGRKRVYEDQLARCEAKYGTKQGTMRRSATAFCRAAISQRYAHRLGT
jgi:hypothetical protein